ncbi:MAG: helix-turn-helix domain-containing protein [Candidatus Caldarchaeum sp.]|nr:helix-turn-helix domain-containing protein [Candidatus Caldarchaeum sp.]MDW8435737.1 hypothetical protein [Candidatus Caldarchaeum sp.]
MSDFAEQPQKMSDEELLWLVRHKVRRAIILAVGEEGRIGATALKQKLGISTGSLYYNLRQMSQLITQDERKTYRLTDDGLRIYKTLTAQSNSEQNFPKTSRTAEIISSIFFPMWLFSPIYESKVVASVLGPLSLFVIVFVLLAGRHEIFMLNVFPVYPLNHLDFALKLGATYLIGFLILSIFSYLFSGKFRSTSTAFKTLKNSSKREIIAESGRLLSAFSVALLPLGLVPGIAVVDRVVQTSFLSNILLRDALVVLSQSISIFLISAAVAYAKKMRWQTSMGVALAFFYLSHLVNYVTLPQV